MLSESKMPYNSSHQNVAGLSTVVSIFTFSTLSEGRQPDGINPWDTADPFFSAHIRDVLKMTFKCYVRQVIILLGIPGNFISCVVFLKQGLWDRISLLLFSLALADLLTLVTQQIAQVSCYWLGTWGSIWGVDPLRAANWDTLMSAKVMHVSRWSSMVSGTLMVVMSVDRCLSVAAPLRAGRLLNYRSMLTAIVLTYSIHLACDFPSFLVFTVRWRPDPSTNRSVAYMALSGVFTTDSTIPSDILNFLNIATKTLSVIVVIICSAITVVSLRRASRQRQQMTGNVKEAWGTGETRITKMLLFLCVVYVLLLLPEVSSAITFGFVSDYFMFRKYHNTFVIVYEVVIFTASSINSTANFFAYLVLSSKFRKTLNELCPCVRRRGNRGIKQIRETEFTRGTSVNP